MHINPSQVAEDETEQLAKADIPPVTHYDPEFISLTYYPSNVEDSDTVMVGLGS